MMLMLCEIQTAQDDVQHTQYNSGNTASGATFPDLWSSQEAGVPLWKVNALATIHDSVH